MSVNKLTLHCSGDKQCTAGTYDNNNLVEMYRTCHQ